MQGILSMVGNIFFIGSTIQVRLLHVEWEQVKRANLSHMLCEKKCAFFVFHVSDNN